MGRAKNKQPSYNTKPQFKKPKPIKEFNLAQKPIQVFNNHPIPNKKRIEKVYNKIPDDTNIPLQFMTREQYVKKYVTNQEIQNGKPFSPEQKKDFFDYKEKKYSNIVGRYTTKKNPYYKPAVVVFNDPENQKNIRGKNFEKLAWHEYGHELAEKEKLNLKLQQEEYFADKIAENGMKEEIYSDKKAKNKILNEIKGDSYSKDLFKPHYNPDTVAELTAAQKFGGQNLKGLRKIGGGRDRDVYELDDDKVLKIAKNPGGLTQNIGEKDLEYLGMGEQHEQGKDYVVMKKQKPLSKEGKKKLGKIRKVTDEHTSLSPSYNTDVSIELSKENNILDQTGIGTDILDFRPNPKEVFANRQWGEDEEGKPVLIDGGALQDNKSLSKYRVKHFKPTEWEYKDWQDVQRQRSQFKDKGTYKPRDMTRDGPWMVEDVEVPDRPLMDDSSKNKIMYRGIDPYEITILEKEKKLIPHGKDNRIWVTDRKKIAETYTPEEGEVLTIDVPDELIQTAPGRSKMFYVEEEIDEDRIIR